MLFSSMWLFLRLRNQTDVKFTECYVEDIQILTQLGM